MCVERKKAQNVFKSVSRAHVLDISLLGPSSCLELNRLRTTEESKVRPEEKGLEERQGSRDALLLAINFSNLKL